jgi:hypothetical protein
VDTPLREAWAALRPKLNIVDPVDFSADQWSLLERLHLRFNDREAHIRLPLPIARFRDDAVTAIYDLTRQFDEVLTDAPEAMAQHARLFNDDVDRLMSVLVPQARFRKGHFAHGKFTVPQPHGLHTDHSAEDPQAAGEPICIARIETLGTHYVAGDYKAHDPGTQSMLKALRYWIAVPEGQPEHIFADLLERQTLKTIPVNHVMLMVAGNSSENVQVTQHIAAKPPDGGQHSAFFQRQYMLS